MVVRCKGTAATGQYPRKIRTRAGSGVEAWTNLLPPRKTLMCILEVYVPGTGMRVEYILR